MNETGGEARRILVCRGALAAEEALVAEVRASCDRAREDVSLLARPLRVVVPSRSLREHVATRLAAPGAAVGVLVQTLRGLCFEVLRRAVEPLRGGDLLLPVLVRRHAARAPALARGLEALDDGYAAALESVRDLLDAGLTPERAEAVREALGPAEASPAAARAHALVDVACSVQADVAERGLALSRDLFARAAELVAAGALDARGVWVHGYADVTGVQLDVIEALVRHAGARVVLDLPPDPADPEGAPVGAFAERLRARLGFAGEEEARAAAVAAGPALRHAAGSHVEVRAVAEDVFALGEAGVPLESVAIVARDLGPYRFALATQLGRLAIPFSGGDGFATPAGRRLAALFGLIEEGERAPADRWLEACHASDPRLRLALHGIGAGRLRDVAELDLAELLGEAEWYALPLRRWVSGSSESGEAPDPAASAEAPEADDAEAEPTPAATTHKLRRGLPRKRLEAACEAAVAVRESLAALRAPATLGEQLARLDALKQLLGWSHPTPGRAELDAAARRLREEIGENEPLDGAELCTLLRRALPGRGLAPLGGAGGGVRVLTVTEARARTFAHLFLIGANRDVFPRPFAEDPLLPDAQRRAIEPVLPDIPVKRRSVDEDRYLFAQLLSSAPDVHVSWQRVSDDGKERPASPLVDRLGAREEEKTGAPTLWGERRAGVPRPPLEHAVACGLAGDTEGTAEALRLALEPVQGERAAEVARARVAAGAELGLRPWDARLGPYDGLVGPQPATELSVTRLERAVACPWQVFLERVLDLVPPADALAALPELTGLAIGNTVHRALEAIALRSGVPTEAELEDARAAKPIAVEWPGEAELASILERAARTVARDEGIVLPAFPRLLARRARRYLEQVRAVDWARGAPQVVGVEVKGRCEVAVDGQPRVEVTFRADRVDRANGGLVLSDYKTGKAFSKDQKPDERTDRLLERTRAGVLLQGAAYALAAGPQGAGRYLYARPDVEPAWAEVRIRTDADLEADFDAVVATIAQAWRAGAFVPRLSAHGREDEGAACRWCRVAEACARGESGARMRIARWLAAPARDDERQAEAAARALLALGKTS